MRKYTLTALIIISIMLAGCDTNAGTVNLTVNETSAEITEVTNESIHMNNCGSAGEVKQTAEKSKSVNVEYAGSFGVDKVVVNGEVSAKYGEINSNTKKIELVAPAGTNMEFNLKWTEKTWIGIVTAQGKDGQANYKVSVPISVELVNSQDLGCGTSNIVPVNPTNPPIPTSMPTSTNAVELQFPLEISVSAVGWVNTNIEIRQGNKVTITYISGQWKAAPDWDLVGPKGDWRYVMSEYRLPSYPLLTLIGRIGETTPFFVGEGLTFTATTNGELQLGANDIENLYGDNDGSLIVKVNVEK
jgi:hypothetical protein